MSYYLLIYLLINDLSLRFRMAQCVLIGPKNLDLQKPGDKDSCGEEGK